MRGLSRLAIHKKPAPLSPWLRLARSLACMPVLACPLHAQNITEDQKRQAGELVSSDIGGMPLLFRTPETGLALGGVFLYTNGLHQKRPSPIISGLMYTEKKQILWGIGGRQILPAQDKSIYFYGELARFPQSFFGTGRSTKAEDRSSYLELHELLEFGGDHEILPHLSIGGGLMLRNDNFLSQELDGEGLLGRNLYLGEDGGSQRGAQAYVLWESIDDNFFPSHGMKLQFFHQHYLRAWGSQYPFSAQKLDTRFYKSWTADWIQASQFFMQNQSGEPPFFQLAQLGGNDILRGYFKGRYRDRKLLVAQTESRYRLARFWNAAFFAGVGNVARDWSEFPEQPLKPSYGTGIRYQLTPQQKINVRLDLGFGQNQGGPQVYLYVMEAY